MSTNVDVLKRTFYAKKGMSVYEIQQKGNTMQKKYAHIFDSDANGVFDAREAKLFNASILKEEQNGDLTIWTNFTTGKKKTTMNPYGLEHDRLGLFKFGKDEQLIKVPAPDDTYDEYGREKDGVYEITIGESREPNGNYIITGNVTKYYDDSKRLTGIIERKNGKDYYKDKNGNILYSVRVRENGYDINDVDYYDNKDRLRYSVNVHDNAGTNILIDEFSEKGELVKTHNSFFCADVCYDPHESFVPLKERLSSSYYMPED